MKILRLDNTVAWESDRETIRECLVAAVAAGVDLQEVNLQGADLRYVDFQYTNLQRADLRCADLQYTNLQRADLRYADLQQAKPWHTNLRYADLQYANFTYADLRCADLTYADLRRVSLFSADLHGTNLKYACLQNADLRGAKNLGTHESHALAIARLSIVPQGRITAWKIGIAPDLTDVLIQLEIPDDARRSNATGRKCRAECADVIEVIGATEARSSSNAPYEHRITYRAGERVHCHEWCEDRWQECAGGIHFYLTREEAEANL